MTFGAAGGTAGAAAVWKLNSCTPLAGVDSGVPQVSFKLFVRRTTTCVEFGRLLVGVKVSVWPPLVRFKLPVTKLPPETSPPLIVAPAKAAKVSAKGSTGSKLKVEPLMPLPLGFKKLMTIGRLT